MSIPLISDLVQVNSNITLKQSSAGNNFITFQGPATVTGYTLTFPAAQASGAQVLRNDGTGVLSWYTLPSSTLTINSTAIAGFSANDLLYVDAGGILQNKAESSLSIAWSRLTGTNSVTITGGSITGTSISGSTGSFTTLSASSTVSGTGFSNLFASPYAIGGTAPNSGKFTTLEATTSLQLDGATSGNIILQAFSTTTGYTITFPSAQGAANSYLKNDGSGGLSWATLGTMATQNANAVAITGGTIDGVAIGNTTRSTGKFTSLDTSGQIISTLATGTAPLVIASTTGVANLSLSGGGSINNTPIGASTPNTGHFTLLTVDSSSTFGGLMTFPNTAGHTITGIPTPVNSTDVANKSYVDAASSAFNVHPPARVATTVALTDTSTVGTTDANGGVGIGYTLTNAGTMLHLSIDGISLLVSDRVLVKNNADQTQNGIYTVTVTGDNTSNWVLTRATDDDDHIANQMAVGDYVFIQTGTINGATSWVETGYGPGGSVNLVIGTSNVTYSQFGGAGTYTAGTGLTLTGTQFSLTIPVLVGSGGTGAITFSAGYLKSPGGTGAFTTVSSIPNTDISGLGTMATQNASAVAITGGTINGTTIGASSPTTATFTNVRVTGISSTSTPSQNLTGNATLSSGTVTVTITTEADANYRITLTGNTNEVFYVTNKTTTNFVINSSNGASTASVDWMLLR